MSNLKQSFINKYKVSPTHEVTSSGRFEIIGNHTDHNGGLCVAASCDLMIDGLLAKRDDLIVAMCAEGYEDVSFSLNDLSIKKEEIGTSTGLIKGVAKYFVDHNFKIGGFYLYSTSNIFKGACFSSSPAFESMIGTIFNEFYNDSKLSPLDLAKAGQYSENNYFAKNSGLLDQSSICYGDISFLDFKNPIPSVETLHFPFNDLQFVIINTGGSHEKMSNLYSSIPADMLNSAKKLCKTRLIDANLDDLEANKNALTEMEYLRSLHFYNENERVKKLVESVRNKNKELFLKCIKESFESSRDNLKNMMAFDKYEGSPLEACDYAYKFLGSNGACKINGGGFAGSIIAVVDKGRVDEFIKYMSIKYGKENIAKVNINPNRPCVKKI